MMDFHKSSIINQHGMTSKRIISTVHSCPFYLLWHRHPECAILVLLPAEYLIEIVRRFSNNADRYTDPLGWNGELFEWRQRDQRTARTTTVNKRNSLNYSVPFCKHISLSDIRRARAFIKVTIAFN